MASVLGEIKRRKVFRVAVAYAIVGWLIAQVAALTFPILLLPDWILRAFVICVILGFPVALILAWAYEATPDGVRRDTGVRENAGEPARAATKRQWSIRSTFGNVIALLIGVLIGSVFGRLTLELPETSGVSRTPIQLTANPVDDAIASAAISPDGRYLAYVDNRGLLLRLIRSGETHKLALPDEYQTGNMEIDWFPDGAHLLVNAVVGNAASLSKLAIVGGEPRQLQDDAWRATISPDGMQIAYLIGRPAREIHIMGPEGGARRKLLEIEDNAIWELAWSPDSRWLVYGVGLQKGQRIEAIDVSAGTTKTVMTDSRLFQNWRGSLPFYWAPDERLIYALRDLPPNEDASNLWQIRLDVRSAEVSGEPSQITRLTGYNFTDISMTSDGARLAFVLEQNQQDVYVGELLNNDTQLGSVRRLTLDEREDFPGGWTADSTEVLFYSERGVSRSLFRQHFDEPDAVVVSTIPDEYRKPFEVEGSAEMSSDGTWILYWQAFDEGKQLMRVPTDGGAPEAVLDSGMKADFHCPRDAGPAADCVLGFRDDNNRYVFSRFDPVYGLGDVIASVEDRPPFVSWDLSPDGRYAAIVHNDGPARVIDLESGVEREVSRDGWTLGEFVAWSASGRGLVMDANSGSSIFRKNLVHVPLDSDEVHVLRRAPNQWHVMPKVSPDGRYLAFGLMVFSGNAWMIQDP